MIFPTTALPFTFFRLTMGKGYKYQMAWMKWRCRLPVAISKHVRSSGGCCPSEKQTCVRFYVILSVLGTEENFCETSVSLKVNLTVSTWYIQFPWYLDTNYSEWWGKYAELQNTYWRLMFYFTSTDYTVPLYYQIHIRSKGCLCLTRNKSLRCSSCRHLQLSYTACWYIAVFL